MLDTHAAPGPQFRVQKAGPKFWVIDPKGNSVADFACRRAATEAAGRMQDEADRRAKRGPRPCMCCGRTFVSEGIHNRMCSPCRSRGDSGSLSIPAGSKAKIRRAAS